MVAGKYLKDIVGVYFVLSQKVSSASPTDAVIQIKEEKTKENEAVNQHQNDVSCSLIPHNNVSGFWPGSEKVLKSRILCCVL